MELAARQIRKNHITVELWGEGYWPAICPSIEELLEHGFGAVEYILTKPSTLTRIEQLKTQTGSQVHVVAGIVKSPVDIESAPAASRGAFVSPHRRQELSDASHEEDVLHHLGMLTPTDAPAARLQTLLATLVEAGRI